MGIGIFGKGFGLQLCASGIHACDQGVGAWCMNKHEELMMQRMIDDMNDLTGENLKLQEKINQLHEINDDLYMKYMKVSGLLRLYENMERKKRMEK